MTFPRKPIPKRSLRAVEKVVHVPQVLHEEQVVEVPQAMGLLASFNWKFEGLMGMGGGLMWLMCSAAGDIGYARMTTRWALSPIAEQIEVQQTRDQ